MEALAFHNGKGFGGSEEKKETEIVTHPSKLGARRRPDRVGVNAER
jgi:hypothetical protein